MNNQINKDLVKKEYLSGLSRQCDELSRILFNAEQNVAKLVVEKKNQWFITKGNENIIKLQGKIACFENEIERTQQGNNMEKIDELYSERMAKEHRNDLDFKRKRHEKVEKKKEEKVVLKGFFADQKAINKDNRNQKYQMKKAYYHLVRTEDRFPDHLREKLKNMPNNRGYIYNSVRYYGELPENKYQPILLFERQRNGTLLTHEYTDDEYIIYSKPKNGKQQIISREKIVHKFPELARKMTKKPKARLPGYLHKKLENMTKNRGYIYNGIKYYGILPDNLSEPMLLFERQRNGTLLTHEYTDTEYIVHSKPKNGKQTIIKRGEIVDKFPELARKMTKRPIKKRRFNTHKNHPYSTPEFRDRKKKIQKKKKKKKELQK